MLLGNLPYVAFKTEVSLGEITNLITVLFIGIYVPFFLSRQISDKRIEKDILIGSCDILCSELYKLRALIEAAHVKKSILKQDLADTIVLRLRNIGCMLDLLKSDCKAAYKEDEKIDQLIATLISNNNDYWSDISLNLRDSSPSITVDAYIRAEKQLNRYLGNISKLKMLINGA